MEFGIFNSLYLPHPPTDADPRHAEHNRLIDEVTWPKAADANPEDFVDLGESEAYRVETKEGECAT